MYKKIIIIIFIFYNLIFFVDFPRDEELAQLIFLDIGQGDSALLISPGGKTVLIDGGPSADIVFKISNYLNSTKTNLDWVVLSHAHKDHYYGLMHLSNYYSIDNYIGSLTYDHLGIKSWEESLSARGTKIWPISKKIIQHNLEDACYFQVLSPPILFLKKNVSINNSSLAVKINCWQINALLIGDAEKESELLFLEYAPADFLETDIFKANHHGSKTSNQIVFLQALKARYVVISAGKNNRYGHPHQEALNNFKALNLQIYRTDQDGDIGFISNKRELWVQLL